MATSYSQKINVNRATEEELQQISGIGPKIAHSIVELRDMSNGVVSREDLMAIKSLRVNEDIIESLSFTVGDDLSVLEEAMGDLEIDDTEHLC